MTEEDPYLDPLELKGANERWDRENHSVAMLGRVNPSWNEARMVVRGKLSDKKIAQYEKLGFYSVEYKKLRKERMVKKSSLRTSNFVENKGRLIYSPL